MIAKYHTPSNGQKDNERKQQTDTTDMDKSDHSFYQTEQFLKSGQIHPYIILQFIFCVNL